MDVREGYKQTEVGVIPQDWEVSPLGNYLKAAPDYGINAAAIAYDTRHPKYLRITDITEDGRLDKESNASISHLSSGAYLLKFGDIVFARTGASVGKSYLYNPNDGKLVFAGFLIRVCTDSEKLSPTYLSCFAKSRPFWSWVKVNSMRSGQPGINGREYASLPIPLPPTKTEQESIAKALSDTDALIESLKQLIEKKRNIKQGAMQELLTGKRRLPGFSGEWIERELPKICWFQEGPGVRKYQFTNDGIKLLNGTNIFRGKVQLNTTNRYIAKEEAFGNYRHFLVDNGDILIASSGITIDKFEEKVAVASNEDLPLCMNTSTIRLRPSSDELSSDFLYFFLQSNLFKKQIGKQATGSAQINFGPAHLRKIILLIPPTFEEQEKITEILRDFDNELQKLEEQNNKLIDVKQAMMQSLLTGKIRLI